MVKKYDKPNEARFLFDLVDRNKITQKDNTPIPDITSIINQIARHPFRSKIDLTDGYHNVRIEPESEKYASFYTTIGIFRTRVMQQGDCNAPATFMKLMQWVFQGMIGKNVYVYLDDILIFTKTKEEHIATLKEICTRLRKHKLYGNRSKTMILPDELVCLGHSISNEGIIAAPEKILNIQNWPTPERRKQLQGFIGLVNYLSTYVPSLATIAAPLTRLCGDTQPFIWKDIHDESFQQIKNVISAEAILKPLDYASQEPVYLVSDESLTGIGAWIGQGPEPLSIRPAAFHSRKFTQSQQNYSVTDKELFAIIEGLRHFEPQLAGHKFTILTDHRPALEFAYSKDVTPRHVRWQMKLSRFDYDIQYLKGQKNILADTLSRSFKNPEKLPPILIQPNDPQQQSSAPNSSTNALSIPKTLPNTNTNSGFDTEMHSPKQTISSAAVTTRSQSQEAAETLTNMQWKYTMKSMNVHMKCDYNQCSGRSALAGHHPNCPLHDEANGDDNDQDEDDEMQEEDNQEPPVEINQQSERKPADQTRMDVDTCKPAIVLWHSYILFLNLVIYLSLVR